MEKTYSPFATRLRDLRKERGLSQPALARLLPGDTTGQQISNYERDVNQPSPMRLMHIAEVFEVPLEYLAEGLEPTAKRTQLDRIELMLEALVAHAGLDVRQVVAAAGPSLRVIEAAAETARQDGQLPRDTPEREDEESAPGRSAPRRAGNGHA